MIAATSKFRSENPKLYAAFLAALKEATDFINADKRKGGEIYLKMSGDKTPIEDIMEILADPAIIYQPRSAASGRSSASWAERRHVAQSARRLARHVLPRGSAAAGG